MPVLGKGKRVVAALGIGDWPGRDRSFMAGISKGTI
jgi:hypothetical protein